MKNKLFKCLVVVLIISNILAYTFMLLNFENKTKKCCELVFGDERYYVECEDVTSCKFIFGRRKANVSIYDTQERKRLLCYGILINNMGRELDADNFDIKYNPDGITVSFRDYRDREVDKYILFFDEYENR